MKTFILTTLLALGATLLSAHPAQADDFYVTIDGVHQGLFHGESEQRGHEHQIPGLKYNYSVTVPIIRDGGGGSGVGKPRQTPVVFEKEWGAATTQIYQALITGERLKTVTFEFYNTGADGRQKQAFRVTLTGAFIVGIHQHVGDTRHDSALDTRRYEDISVSFQKIEIADETSSTTAGEQAHRTPAVRPARPS